jgi:hypothetical protein
MEKSRTQGGIIVSIIIRIFDANTGEEFAATEPISMENAMGVMNILFKPSMFGNDNFVILTEAILDD